MPSHRNDPALPEDVTLNDYVDRVAEVIDKAGEPTILVEHSLGGATITQAGGNFTRYIRGLIYLAAAIPRNGQCPVNLTLGNDNSKLNHFRQVSEDGKSVFVVEKGIK